MTMQHKGKNIMIFVEDEAVALATNHTLNINAQILEEHTKDDALGPVGEFDYADWDATIDSVLGANDGVSAEQTYADLIALQLAGTEVDVAFGAVPDDDADGAVPAAGWEMGVSAGTDPTTDFPPFVCSKGLISEVSLNAPDSGNATVSCKLIAVESF